MSRITARTADKYVLYESSVQDPAAEVKFVRRVYRKMFGKDATRLREDFCGTGAIACRWVKSFSQLNSWQSFSIRYNRDPCQTYSELDRTASLFVAFVREKSLLAIR